MDDDAGGPIEQHWVRQSIGGGQITGSASSLRLSFDSASADHYVDAEVHDYATSRRTSFRWRPPVRMTLRARFSHPIVSRDVDEPKLVGTAGFGFWNAPFMLANRTVRLPDAVWFLSNGPPSWLELVPEIPGYGWKAQVVHTQRWGVLAEAIPTLASVAWARLTGNDRLAGRWVQRLCGAHESILIPTITEWHDYRLDWLPDIATFFVNDECVMTVPHPPQGPLGFVAWIDNQTINVTPSGKFRSGIISSGPQWLEIADLDITSLSAI